MTQAELEEHMSAMLAISGLDLTNSDPQISTTKFAKDAIKRGLSDFWHAKNWSFAVRTYDMSIASEATSYNLPRNFRGYVSLREHESTSGMSLNYRSKSDFDEQIPWPDNQPTGYPQIFTIYYDMQPDRWKISFFPIPETGATLYLTYTTTVPSTVDEVPKMAEPALIAACEKYVTPPGSTLRWSANNKFREEINELERRDSPIATNTTRMLDDTSQQIVTERPWM